MNSLALPALSLVIEVALLLGVALALCALLRPALRVLIFRAAFAVAAFAPLTLFFTQEARPALWTIPAAGQMTVPALANADTAGLPWASVALDAMQSGLPVVFGLWLVGALLVLAQTMRAHLQLAHVHAAGTPLPDSHLAMADALGCPVDLRVRIEIRESAVIATPMVFGFTRPRMLLPASISEAALPMILLHEFCHMRHGDTLWLFAERLACALHWYNPLIWLCARRHRDDTELVCDEAAASMVSAKDYATALIEVARMALPSFAAGAVAMSGRGLSQRVRALISRTEQVRPPTLRLQGAVASCAMAAIFLLGAAQIVSAETGDRSDLMSAAAARGNGMMFVDAPPGVRIEVGATGACWDGARCVFEHPLGAVVEVRAEGRGQIELQGCDDVQTGFCAARVSSAPVHISVKDHP